jgi:pimeloyl-ACP methyl ester carboxylesterase
MANTWLDQSGRGATLVLPRNRVEAAGGVFDVATLGSGTPTVVFVNGLGTQLEEWALVAPDIAKRCRVVCYDRRRADPSGQPHDAATMVGDLWALLGALDAPAPYVLVGHSWGGLVARRFAAEHPGDVVGMVYVDASHEQLKGMTPGRVASVLYAVTWLAMRLPPVRRQMLRMLGFDRLAPAERDLLADMQWPELGRTARAELAGITPSCRELAALAPALPDVPTQVLLAGGRPTRFTKVMAKTFTRIRTVWEGAALGLANANVRTVPNVGHYISLEDPQSVIDAIEWVIDAVPAPPEEGEP